MFLERKNTQFIPKEKNLLDLISGQLWEAEIREPQGEKLAADLRQQTMHTAWTIELLRGGGGLYSCQYALNIIAGPYMHMGTWLCEHVFGCAYLCVHTSVTLWEWTWSCVYVCVFTVCVWVWKPIPLLIHLGSICSQRNSEWNPIIRLKQGLLAQDCWTIMSSSQKPTCLPK